MTEQTITWETINSYWTQPQVQCMIDKAGIDLSDCATVIAIAQDIYDRVTGATTPQMPYGGPYWSKEWCDNFKTWMDSNPTCPSSVQASEPELE